MAGGIGSFPKLRLVYVLLAMSFHHMTCICNLMKTSAINCLLALFCSFQLILIAFPACASLNYNVYNLHFIGTFQALHAPARCEVKFLSITKLMFAMSLHRCAVQSAAMSY